MIDVPLVGDPDSVAMRGELARLFIQHKAKLGLPDTDDAQIARGTDEITWLLISRRAQYEREGRGEEFDSKFGWFTEALDRLMADQPATRLDG